jgi:carbon starvation protein
VAIFATGASKFMGAIGLPQSLAMEFTLLAVSTFLLTTLDTCTRLSRFILEEFLQMRTQKTRWLGTAAVLVIPAIAVFIQIDGQPAWKAVWPLFGSTNQLMAALALLTFLVYLKSRTIKYGFIIPATAIMVVMPLAALVIMAWKKGPFSLLGGIAVVMLVLGGFVTAMSLKYVFGKPAAD